MDLRELGDKATQVLDAFCAQAGLTSSLNIVQQGDPATVIAEYAKEHDVDLIMMPTHGWRKFRSLLPGSVTAKVLHDAACAIWTAAHTTDSDLSSHLDCKSILAAIDLAAFGVSRPGIAGGR